MLASPDSSPSVSADSQPLPPGLSLCDPEAFYEQAGSEYLDVLELNLQATELQRRGLPLTPFEAEGGRGLMCPFSYRGVGMLLRSFFAEGPHYFVLRLDIAAAVERAEPPDALLADLLEALGLPAWLKSWEFSGLEQLFHLRADEKYVRDQRARDLGEHP